MTRQSRRRQYTHTRAHTHVFLIANSADDGEMQEWWCNCPTLLTALIFSVSRLSLESPPSLRTGFVRVQMLTLAAVKSAMQFSWGASVCFRDVSPQALVVAWRRHVCLQKRQPKVWDTSTALPNTVLYINGFTFHCRILANTWDCFAEIPRFSHRKIIDCCRSVPLRTLVA